MPRIHPRRLRCRFWFSRSDVEAPGSAFSSHVMLMLLFHSEVGLRADRLARIPYMMAVRQKPGCLMTSWSQCQDTWGQWRGAEKLRSMNWPPRSGPLSVLSLWEGMGLVERPYLVLYWELPPCLPLADNLKAASWPYQKQHGLGCCSIFRIRKFL